jgi:hypothetical protein
MTDAKDARIAELEAELKEKCCRLDQLSKAVRKAWDVNREGDMWKALSTAMDIVDPARNGEPERAEIVERACECGDTNFSLPERRCVRCGRVVCAAGVETGVQKCAEIVQVPSSNRFCRLPAGHAGDHESE